MVRSERLKGKNHKWVELTPLAENTNGAVLFITGAGKTILSQRERVFLRRLRRELIAESIDREIFVISDEAADKDPSVLINKIDTLCARADICVVIDKLNLRGLAQWGFFRAVDRAPKVVAVVDDPREARAAGMVNVMRMARNGAFDTKVLIVNFDRRDLIESIVRDVRKAVKARVAPTLV
jgi:hypothetical protein